MRPHLVAAVALALFAIFVLTDIATTSPTYDEPAHLVAGVSYLTTGDFRLNPEHPPLLKMIAAAPVLLMRIAFPGNASVREAWAMSVVNVNAEWSVGRHWFTSDAPFFRARVMILMLGIALGALIFLWSKELWGAWGGAISAALFALDPNFIAHSGLVTTDVGVSLLMFAAVYFFWRWHQRPALANAIAFVIAFALAQIAKFSAIVLVPIVIVLALRHRARIKRSALLIAAAAVATIAVIWAAYAFRWSAAADPARAADEEAIARANPAQPELDAPESLPHGYFPTRDIVEEWAAKKSGDRTATAKVPLGFSRRLLLFAAEKHLLPEGYVFGMSWVGSMSVFRVSYLNGQHSDTGFGSYFLWTTLYKTPLPSIALIAAGLWLARKKAGPFLFWPVVIYLAVTLTSNLNIGHRHLLPIFPFVYVACGSLSAVRGRAGRIACAALFASLIAIDAWMHGRHLSYMNVPNGWTKLSDSNFDWGQDLERLGTWLREHDVREPVNLVYFGTADPRWYGINARDLRNSSFPDPQVPGYFAISSADYLGIFFGPARRTYWSEYLERAGATPVDTAGSTIFIYRIERKP